MSLLALLASDLKIDPDFPARTSLLEEPLDLEALSALADFALVPIDYIVLYSYYGQVGFSSALHNLNLNLRHPFEAHEFYFGDERDKMMPNLFPAASTSSSCTLYYGSVDERVGVYIARDSSSWLSMSEYVAPSISDILFKGAGLEIIGSY